MIIVLSGYMASGKSSTGRALARRLGCTFVDLDTAIEEREGRKVKEIFASDGEVRFRQLEALALSEILAAAVQSPSDLVLSLGGGTLMQPAAREALDTARTRLAGSQALRIVYLRTAPATIRRRLEGAGDDRPMLRSHDLEALLGTRIPTYEATADTIIDTDDLTPEEIAEKISIFA